MDLTLLHQIAIGIPIAAVLVAVGVVIGVMLATDHQPPPRVEMLPTKATGTAPVLAITDRPDPRGQLLATLPSRVVIAAPPRHRREPTRPAWLTKTLLALGRETPGDYDRHQLVREAHRVQPGRLWDWVEQRGQVMVP